MIKVTLETTYNGYIFTGNETELVSLIGLLRKLVVIDDMLQDDKGVAITVPGDTVRITISDVIPQQVRSSYDPAFKDLQIADLQQQKDQNFRWWREAEDKLAALHRPSANNAA